MPDLAGPEPWKDYRNVYLKMPVMPEGTHPIFFTDLNNPPGLIVPAEPPEPPNFTLEEFNWRMDRGMKLWGRLT